MVVTYTNFPEEKPPKRGSARLVGEVEGFPLGVNAPKSGSLMNPPIRVQGLGFRV